MAAIPKVPVLDSKSKIEVVTPSTHAIRKFKKKTRVVYLVYVVLFRVPLWKL